VPLSRASLRLSPPLNSQTAGIRHAAQYLLVARPPGRVTATD
jgi:hypothetical protein